MNRMTGRQSSSYLKWQRTTQNFGKVAHKVEGLVCGTGIHAGGVIFVDTFTDQPAWAPDGTICTQFDLHDCEDCSLIKYDALSVEAMDKITIVCFDYGYIERKETLKETRVLVYIRKRPQDVGWWFGTTKSRLFQMEKQSGIQGIATLKPTRLTTWQFLNSTNSSYGRKRAVKCHETCSFQEWPRWDRVEMGSRPKRKRLEPVLLGMSYGLWSQEQFMELVQLPELGGFSDLGDKLRKSIAKKNPRWQTYKRVLRRNRKERNKSASHIMFGTCLLQWVRVMDLTSHTLLLIHWLVSEMNLRSVSRLCSGTVRVD